MSNSIGKKPIETAFYFQNETFENRDPFARRTFFEPAPSHFAANTKLALKRLNSRLCGYSVAGAGCPEKSPIRASGIRF
jgi:hypothetical protein